MNKCIVLFVFLLVPCSTMYQDYIINLTSEGTNVTITSPNFPDNYDTSASIYWQVIAPTGYRVMIQFNDFDLQPQRDDGAYYDILRVYHGLTDSFQDATRRAILSGSSLPDDISSIGSYLWIRFTSDGSVTKKGFSLSVRAVQPDWACDFKDYTCGLMINEGSWTIGEQNNYYYIEADESGSSFTIPHVFTSAEGSLSFGLYQKTGVRFGQVGQVTVTVCKSQDLLSFRLPSISFVYLHMQHIQYSCSGIQDIEVKFTESGSQSTRIRVLDIQLYEITGPSTASSSTIIMNTTPLQTTTPESTQSEVLSKGPSMVGTSLSLVPILSSTLASLSGIAIIVLIVCLVCRQNRLKHGSSERNAAFVEPRESPGMRDNPTFESPIVHDIQMSDVADRHGGNDPYIALTTPHDGPTVLEYQTLGQVISQGDGYEVPINRANGLTGPENDKSLHKLQVHPEIDYEIKHEYQDFSNRVVGRNHSHNESPLSGFQAHPETDYETTHEYEELGIIGRNIPHFESHINGLPEMSKTDYETTPEYDYVDV